MWEVEVLFKLTQHNLQESWTCQAIEKERCLFGNYKVALLFSLPGYLMRSQSLQLDRRQCPLMEAPFSVAVRMGRYGAGMLSQPTSYFRQASFRRMLSKCVTFSVQPAGCN
ncbi:hypothetical protein PTKIN_Ptkin14bG0082500 [Pterospermum kingtungense]